MSAVADEQRVSRQRGIPFATLLLIISAVRAIGFLIALWTDYAGSNGYLASPNHPFGSDFINLWTAGRMALAGLIGDIYSPDAFMAYQHGFVSDDIGFRVWAYPPHSLIMAWPFGLLGYYPTYLLWSALGLAVLVYGARKFGFGWTETGILALSPAAMQNVILGQTGNLACGLLLAALAGVSIGSRSAIVSAAILTIKPQTGFLLPLIWLRNKRWGLVAGATIAIVALVALSIMVFGADAWRAYIGETLPELAQLEREGSGPFMQMIPSTFMSMRLLGFDADGASLVHFAFAGLVMAVLLWRLWVERSPERQAALILIGVCLVTPYMHLYDLTVLMAGGLILMRDERLSPSITKIAAILAWILPMTLGWLAVAGLPIAPLIVLFVFAVACIPERGGTMAAGKQAT